MRRSIAAAIVGLSALAASTAPSFAEEHVIKMLNKGERGVMVFEPAVVKADLGDTLHFVPVDPLHNAISVKGMLPEGAKKIDGKMNQEFTYTLEKPGIYGIRCTPHYAMGMVALVEVGDDPPNFDEARAIAAKTPGRAKQRFSEFFDELQAMQ